MLVKKNPGEYQYYVVEDEWGNFWCGQGFWEERLNHAVQYTSLRHAQKCAQTYKARHPVVRRVVILFDDYGISPDGTEFTYEYNIEMAEGREETKL